MKSFNFKKGLLPGKAEGANFETNRKKKIRKIAQGRKKLDGQFYELNNNYWEKSHQSHSTKKLAELTFGTQGTLSPKLKTTKKLAKFFI